MLADWIRREPAAFSAFVRSAVGVLNLLLLGRRLLDVQTSIAILGMAEAGLAWVTRALSTPNVKVDAKVAAAVAERG